MSLDKVDLDYIYRDSLEQLAIKSGWIDKELDAPGKPRPVFHYPRQSERNMLKSKTLRLITLFRTIDSDISGLSWTRFIREGIVEEDAVMMQHDPRPILRDPPSSEKPLVDFAMQNAHHLLKYFKNEFIRYHIRRWFRGFYDQPKGVSTADLFQNYDWVLSNLGTSRIIESMSETQLKV